MHKSVDKTKEENASCHSRNARAARKQCMWRNVEPTREDIFSYRSRNPEVARQYCMGRSVKLRGEEIASRCYEMLRSKLNTGSTKVFK